jgi:WD40 repeat protein
MTTGLAASPPFNPATAAWLRLAVTMPKVKPAPASCATSTRSQPIHEIDFEFAVRFWQGAECIATYTGHTRSITNIASLPSEDTGTPSSAFSGRWLITTPGKGLDIVSASMDESIRIWQASRPDKRYVATPRRCYSYTIIRMSWLLFVVQGAHWSTT